MAKKHDKIIEATKTGKWEFHNNYIMAKSSPVQIALNKTIAQCERKYEKNIKSDSSMTTPESEACIKSAKETAESYQRLGESNKSICKKKECLDLE
jgi:hypothetical protein